MHVLGRSTGRLIQRGRFRSPASAASGRGRRARTGDQREIELAVAEERRRLARELHDSLAQDLAYIVSQSLRLAHGKVKDPTLERIAAAAERALDDAREAIYRLSRPGPSTLGDAVREQADRVAQRAGLRLCFEVADEVETTPEIEHAVLRIVQEAVSNAARHAHGTTVFVSLSSSAEKLVVTVADDGRGFDPTEIQRTASGGFGLISMRERARAVGGEVRLDSRRGGGTVVEVDVPA